MTFLNTLFLFALTAAAVPIIIHLLNLHRIRTVDFSTLRFLKQVQRKQMKKLQLKRWWLLLLRVLAVLLLVLAFARPALRTAMMATGSNTQTAAAIILDNSASTLLDDNLYHIKERCQEVLDQLQDGDLIMVVPLQGGSGAALQTRQLELAREYIHGLSATPLGGDPLEVISETVIQLAAKADLNKELYICSDFSWEGPEAEWLDSKDELSDLQLFLLPLFPADPANLALVEVDAITRSVSVDGTVPLTVTLANHGDTDRLQILLQVYLEQVRVAEQMVSLAAHCDTTVILEIDNRSAGFVSGRVTLEDPALHWDNHRFFTLFVPDRYQVAVIGDDRKTSGVLQAALLPDSSYDGRIELDLLTTAAAQGSNLDRYDVIILNSIQPAEAVYRRVRTAMQAGAGLIYFPDCAHNAAGSGLLANEYLGIPPLLEVTESQNRDRAYIELGFIDRQHPFLAPLFESRQQVESPRVKRYGHFSGSAETDPLLKLANGDLFAGLQQLEEQALLFFTVPLSSEDSDFFHKGLFAPLMNRAVDWVASGKRGIIGRTTAGEPLTLEFPFHAAQWRLQQDAVTLFPQTVSRMSGDWLSIPATLVPGNYRVVADGREAGMLSVNIDPVEGSGAGVSLQSWQEIERFNPLVIDGQDAVDEVVESARHGRELWRLMLAAALFLLLLEAVISRRK